MHDVVKRVSDHWLVFDLGGVLVDVADGDVTHGRLAADFGIEPARLETLLTAPDTGQQRSAIERFETGELSVDGLLERLNEAASTPLTRDAFVVSLNAMLVGGFDETAELVAELSEAGYGIACYSNTNPVHWSYIQRQFAFFDEIIEPFASHVVGHRKPDPEGYERVSAALNAEPGDCVLIDDRIENVEGARAAGWQAHHFRSVAALRTALIDIGVHCDAAS